MRNWQRVALIGIVALAFALRVGAVLGLGVVDVVDNNESTFIANSLAHGQGFAFDFYGARQATPLLSFMPPLYPYWVAIYLRCFAQPALALELSQALLSTLTVLLLYAVASRLSGHPMVGLLTAVGVAIYPPFIIMSGYPVTVTVNTFLIAMWSVLNIGLQHKPSIMRAVLTGSVLGALVLSRPAALGLLAASIGWVGLTAAGPFRQRLRVLSTMTAATLMVLLPWTIRNYQVHGRFMLVSTNGGFTFWQGNNPFTLGNGFEVDGRRLAQFLGGPYDPSQPATVHLMPYVFPAALQSRIASLEESELDRALFQAGVEFLRSDPGRGLELIGLKLQDLWWFGSNAGRLYDRSWAYYYALLYAALLALALPGLAISGRRWRHYLLIYGLLIYFTLVYVVFNAQVRYRWELEPFLIMFAAVAIVAVGQTLKRIIDRRHGPVAT